MRSPRRFIVIGGFEVITTYNYISGPWLRACASLDSGIQPSMSTIWSRLLALEPHAKLNGLRLDYAAKHQNGVDCWFIATLHIIHDKGLRLPMGFDVKELRFRTKNWLLRATALASSSASPSGARPSTATSLPWATMCAPRHLCSGFSCKFLFCGAQQWVACAGNCCGVV